VTNSSDSGTRTPMGQTILVVDDDLPVQLIVRRVLEGGGHVVRVASSGYLALAAIQAAPESIGLVVSDVRMPGMSGLDLALEVRRSWPNLPILLMSAFEPPEFGSTHAGLVDVPLLRKPFSNDDLLRLVGELLPSPTGR
jgi:CheY-like chemotaxis protein